MKAEFDFPADTYILLGKVVKAQGLRGDIKLFVYSGQPENIGQYRQLTLVDRRGNRTSPLALESNRILGRAAIVKLATIVDRTQAEKVVGCGVLIDRKDLPQVGVDEFYWHEYQNKEVLDVQGNVLGRVTALFHNGAQDIIVVTGEKEILIPVTKETIVDDSGERLIVNLPPGLLNLNTEVDL